ncbi:MAG: efflux RND transporter periplasmic adaptor subunit [Gemmatimonadota bacterium]
MSRMRIVMVGVFAAAAAGCSSKVTADLAVATRGAVAETVDEQGATRVRWHEDVSAPVSGRWQPRALSVGDAVPAGAALGVIEPAPRDAQAEAQLRARLGVARAANAAAEAAASAARGAAEAAARELARGQRLADSGGLAAAELDRLRTLDAARRDERTAAAARVREAAFALREVEAALAPGATQRTPVRAPRAGVVLRRHEEHDRVVLAGTPLVQLGDPAGPELVVPVLTADAARIRPGMPATARLSLDGAPLPATVARVEPAAFAKVSPLGVEEQRVNVVLRAGEGWPVVGDAFRVDVRIRVRELADAVSVPVGALVRHDSAWAVFVVRGRRVTRQAVTLALQGRDRAAIATGLAAGDTVVVYPGDDIADGVRLR